MRNRRRIAAIAHLVGVDFALIGLRQIGVLRRVPDLPIRGFDSNAVITSPAAYPLGVPDAPLALAGCGAISALAMAGGAHRSRALDVALVAAVATGVAGALHYLRQMIWKQKRLCAYCLGAATGFFAMIPLVAEIVRSSSLSHGAGDGTVAA